MIHLIETNFNFVSLIPEIAISTFELSKQVHNIDSKLLIFEFFEHTIVGKLIINHII